MSTNNETFLCDVCRVPDMSDNSPLDEYRKQLREQGHNLAEAKKEVVQERDILKRRVLEALAAGMSELEVSKITTLTRDTVRTWAGK